MNYELLVAMLDKMPEDIINDIYEYNSTHKEMMTSVLRELVEVAAQIECETCKYIHYKKESICCYGYYYCCETCVNVDEYLGFE